jgi:Flp pilus assembly protein TadG
MKTYKIRRQSRASQKGSAILEFSLCFMLIFGLIYGILEFSRVVYSYTVLAGATREASRYAVVHGSQSGSPATNSDIRAQVERWAIGLDTSALAVDTTWPTGNAPSSTVSIATSYTVTPFTTLIMRNPITLRTRSEMVISQ